LNENNPSGRSPVLSPSRTDSRALIVEVGLDDVKTAESSSASVDTGETLSEEGMGRTP
jgi:hypothetical protein